jgi:hypothetical protein
MGGAAASVFSSADLGIREACTPYTDGLLIRYKVTFIKTVSPSGLCFPRAWHGPGMELSE